MGTIDSLTDLAKALDIFFKGLSECGLMTTYSVQLQVTTFDLVVQIRFRCLMYQFVKSLQALLLKIPDQTASIVEVKLPTTGEPLIFTQADDTLKNTTDIIVTCHPVTLATITPEKEVEPEEAGKQDVEEQPAETSEPIVLKPCGEDSSNVVHIVVASTEEQKGEEVKIEDEERGSAIFICEVCERTFVTARSLEIHLNVKHRNKGQCDMCPLRFASIQSLQEHFKAEHKGTGCFNCLLCGRRFMTKLSYKRHMDTHGGTKGAVCDMCGKMFSRTDYLQKHYMTHNGNRPYTCSQCPRKFISSSQLKNHEKVHSGVKEHVCNVCSKAFGRVDKLKEHMFRHLKIKRFQCSYCQRHYAEKRDLNKHLKMHHSSHK